MTHDVATKVAERVAVDLMRAGADRLVLSFRQQLMHTASMARVLAADSR